MRERSDNYPGSFTAQSMAYDLEEDGGWTSTGHVINSVISFPYSVRESEIERERETGRKREIIIIIT